MNNIQKLKSATERKKIHLYSIKFERIQKAQTNQDATTQETAINEALMSICNLYGELPADWKLIYINQIS
jgi:hypothetical protein